MRIPDQIIQRHPDDQSVCPSYTYPFQGRCDRIGTGIHAGMREFHTRDDIVDHFRGHIDMAHFLETNTIRYVMPDHKDRLVVTEVKVIAEIVKVP